MLEKSKQSSMHSQYMYNHDEDSDSSNFEIPESMKLLYNLFERFVRDTHEDSSDERDRVTHERYENERSGYQQNSYQYNSQTSNFLNESDAERQAIEYLISQNMDNPELVQQLLQALQYNNEQRQKAEQQEINPVDEITRSQMLIQHLNALQYENLENNLKYATQDSNINEQLLAQLMQQQPGSDANTLAFLLSQLMANNNHQIPQMQ